MEQSVFEQRPKRDPVLPPFFDEDGIRIRFLRAIDPLPGDLDVLFIALDPDPLAPEPPRGHCSRPPVELGPGD